MERLAPVGRFVLGVRLVGCNKLEFGAGHAIPVEKGGVKNTQESQTLSSDMHKTHTAANSD